MTRAKPLPPDERRRAIIDAARPLVAEHGALVTTAQIAAAAGIAEGTLFRVFPSKAAIILAVLQDTLDPDDLLEDLARLRYDDLHAQVRALLIRLQTHLRDASRMFAIVAALGPETREAAHPAHVDAPHADSTNGCPRSPATARANADRVRSALAEALLPYADRLATSPTKAATLLLGYAAMSSHALVADDSLNDPDDLATLFLHGTERETHA